MKARGAAHGKVILFGEHAVVYGIPALAVGIERGAWAEIASEGDAASGAPSSLRVRGWDVTVSEHADDTSVSLARAFRDILAVTRDAQRAAGTPVATTVTVEATTDLPPGGGLGCSAALGVAVARALDPTAGSDAIAERVGAWEQVFHGNPSGIDAAVATLGGCVHFRRSEDPNKKPSIVRVRVPFALHLAVGHSGQASSTKAMVEGVARMRARRPEIAQRSFDAIDALVKNARLAIEAGDVRAIGQLLDLNQMLLSGLFVSTPEIELMCSTARTAGALGAKLTGAGGGGCVVALVENEARATDVLRAWKEDGFDGFATTVEGEPAFRTETEAELNVLARLV